MYRLNTLVAEINRGVKVDEKSGQKILDWSPNNVRRLVIGWDYFIIQYHMTGGKFKKLLELKNLQSAAVKDAELIVTHQSEKIKPIINALVDGRICSNIEEIVFDISSYDGFAFTLDSNLTKLKGKGNIDSRFPRLQGVYRVDSNFRQMGELIQQCKEPNTSLIEQVKNKGLDVTPVYISSNLENGSWKKGGEVRPQFYMFDEALGGHFTKLRKLEAENGKQDKLKEIDKERNLKHFKKNVFPSLLLIANIKQNLQHSQEIFDKAPLISKSEWAKYLQQDNMLKGMSKEFKARYSNGDDSLINQLRRVDTRALEEFFLEVDNNSIEVGLFRYSEFIFFEKILNSDDAQYKRDSNKLSFEKSSQVLLKAVVALFNIQVNLVYFAFAEYLSRNSPKYAMDFYNKLAIPLDGFMYTRSQIEFYNRTAVSPKEGYAKKSFDIVGGREVLVEQFTTKIKIESVKAIIKSLSS